MLDVFSWFRRKDGARRNAPDNARRNIARPVSAPMFTGRVETMDKRVSAPAPARAEPRGRQEPARPPRARQGDGHR